MASVDKISSLKGTSVAVLLPCYNEGQTIASVIAAFSHVLPQASIYVYDNNSTDDTSAKARAAGAIVVRSPRQGKGNVVRQMFADIDADIYIMADGDGTYDADAAPRLVSRLLEDGLDMVVGCRANVHNDAGRSGHAFGNRLFNYVYQFIFGNDFTDIFSGYRVFTRRFAKSFPASSPGFEIETEMSVHASILRLPVGEEECVYGRRIEGSESKLSTFRDGARILRMMAILMKETRPFLFFSYIATFLLGIAVLCSAPVIAEYFRTGLVERLPTWMLSMTLFICSMLFFMAGVILDSVARSRTEQKHFHYLSIQPARGERFYQHLQPAKERRKG